jgi:carbamoyl-phosphate synthase large subunit
MILGGSETQIPFINIAKNKGYKTIVTDMNKDAYALKFADISLNINALDKELVLKYAKEYKIAGILTKTESLLRTVSYVSSKLNLIGLSNLAAEASHNKLLLRRCMEERGIQVPKYSVVKSISEIDCINNKINYPIVIKPVDSGGSRGVVKIHNEIEFRKSFYDTMKYSDVGEIIIEEFVDGKEYSIETVTQNGKTNIVCITEKTTSGYPYFVETRHMVPANLDDITYDSIKNIVIQTLEAISVNNSIAHTEVKVTDKGPIVIETGARFGGDYICTDLITLATGISMYENLINIIISEPITVKNTLGSYSGIQFVTSFNWKNAIKKHSEIIKDDNYVKHEYYNRENNNKLTNSADRLGYYIFKSDSRKSLLESLDLVNR